MIILYNTYMIIFVTACCNSPHTLLLTYEHPTRSGALDILLAATVFVGHILVASRSYIRLCHKSAYESSSSMRYFRLGSLAFALRIWLLKSCLVAKPRKHTSLPSGDLMETSRSDREKQPYV